MPRMRFRKLRIAWSVACGIACVLLIVLWVRSYWRFNRAEGNVGGTQVRFLAASGKLRFDVCPRWRRPTWEWSSEIIGVRQSVGLNPFNSDGGIIYMNR